MKIITNNRKASFLYHLISKYEAGIQLKGSEVKSIREGKVNIKESYVKIKNGEMFVVGMHIGEYSHSGYSTHDPLREKKLLMNKTEIFKIRRDFDIWSHFKQPVDYFDVFFSRVISFHFCKNFIRPRLNGKM